MIAAIILSLFGLVSFVISMVAIVYIFWKKPKDEPLPTGLYRIRVIGRNPVSGALVYDMEQVSSDVGDIEGRETAKECMDTTNRRLIADLETHRL